MLSGLIENGDKRLAQKIFWWSAGIVISVIFGFLAWRDIRWSIVSRLFYEADVGWLIAAAVAMLLSLTVRSIRWRMLLPESTESSFGTRLSGIIIGYFFSNFLPARLGDFIRPAYLSRASGTRYDISLVSIVGERLWDLSILLFMLLLLIATNTLELPQQIHVDTAVIGGLAAIGGISILLAPQIITGVAAVLERSRLKGTAAYLLKLKSAFARGDSGYHTVRLLMVSIVVFAAEVLFFYSLVSALGLSVSWLGASIVMVITAISFLLPSAPAGIGVYHFFCQAALVSVGVAGSTATGAAILIHAYLFSFVTIAGSIALLWGRKKRIAVKDG